MVELGLLHYLYIFIVLVVLVTMAFKKDIVLPCIIGLFIIGLTYSGSAFKGVQVIYDALIASGTQFWGVIVIISLVVAMSRVLQDVGADQLMMSPVKKLIANQTVAFWILGIFMALISLVIWPSPAVALIGAIMLPAAIKAGLPAIWAAVVMNLSGHGIALSGDYFIQGAPAISSKAAGIRDSFEIMAASFPLWTVMSIVTISVAFIMMRRETKKQGDFPDMADSPAGRNGSCQAEANADLSGTKAHAPCRAASLKTHIIAIITPMAFIIDIIVMYIYQLRGGEATALVGGTAILIMVVASLIHNNLADSLEKVTNYIKDGFVFGIQVFAPVIVIGALFFLGGEETAKQILGENATGLLSDIGIFLSEHAPIAKFPAIIVEVLVGIITGLDGSGFTGLPLVGSLAQTFSAAIDIDKAGLAALGQIVTVWVGGGTIIPWSVIPVAAICNVSPLELARRNMIPVFCGFAAMIGAAMIIL